jgi:hypothetical protein
VRLENGSWLGEKPENALCDETVGTMLKTILAFFIWFEQFLDIIY